MSHKFDDVQIISKVKGSSPSSIAEYFDNARSLCVNNPQQCSHLDHLYSQYLVITNEMKVKSNECVKIERQMKLIYKELLSHPDHQKELHIEDIEQEIKKLETELSKRSTSTFTKSRNLADISKLKQKKLKLEESLYVSDKSSINDVFKVHQSNYEVLMDEEDDI